MDCSILWRKLRWINGQPVEIAFAERWSAFRHCEQSEAKKKWYEQCIYYSSSGPEYDVWSFYNSYERYCILATFLRDMSNLWTKYSSLPISSPKLLVMKSFSHSYTSIIINFEKKNVNYPYIYMLFGLCA